MRPSALEALQGSDLIVHAGDVGAPDIIRQLEAIAPVVAIRGNVDTSAWASSLPPTAVAEAGPAIIYVLHNLEDLDLDPAAAGFHVVVYGHSHKPSQEQRGGVLYLNPGSAGPRRFRLPITVARLDLSKTPWGVEFIDVAGG